MRGRYTVPEALSLMLQGTSLTGELTSSGVITITRSKSIQEGKVDSGRKASLLSGASALLVAWFGASGAYADEAEPTSVDEVIVTATRSNVSLSKVPLSVAAYTQERIDRQGVKSVADIARLTPGLVFTQGSTVSTHGRSRISIRGISSTTGAATTGVYLDESPIQVRNAGFTSTNVYPETFDLERIEVLRGPQGTLFGAGSQGGTVRFITPQPSLTRFQVYARSEASVIQGGDPGAELGVAVGGPIVTDQLGFRASVFYRHTGGYMDRVDPFTGNIVDRNSNRDSALVVRVGVIWAPTENLKITSSVYAQDLEANNGAPFWVSLSEPSEQKFKSANLLSSPSRDRLILPAVNIEYDLGGATLISNTSFFQRDVDNFPDYSQWQHNISIGNPYVKSPQDYSRGIYESKQTSYAQEFRIQSAEGEGRLKWVAGVFWGWSRQSDWEQVSSPNFANYYLAETGVSYLRRYGIPLAKYDSTYTDLMTTHDKQIAAFGQLDFKVTPQLTATLGARASKVKYDFSNINAGPLGGTGLSSGRQSETPIAPKVGLSYQINEGNMAYFSAAKGFRPGGAQKPAPTACLPSLQELGLTEAPSTFDADTVWSYEVGSKNRLFANRLQVEASAFRVDWTNRQSVIPLASCGQTFTANIGKVRSEGFDLSFQVQATSNLSLSGAVGYVNARYVEDIVSGGRFIAKKGTPIGDRRWSASVSGEYTFSVLDHDAYVRADYQYQSHQPERDPTIYGYDGTLPDLKSTDIANLRTGVKVKGAEVAVFIRNVLNAHDYLSYGHDSARSPVFYAKTYTPRTFGISALYSY
ncbi:MAG: hypothetical protein ABS78_06860 [Phenylobacterium sp. SCN 70-31]|nr:MAG: hypothetical protein ABS78_06860 [Phenylobacterium sp. SCN 70-31]